jgi:MFS family permease
MTTPTEVVPAGAPGGERAPAWRARGLVAFGYPAFRWFWTGSLFFQLAMNMGMVGSGWLVYRLTGSALALGGLWTVSGVALVALPMFGGLIADRFSKRWLISLSQSAILLSTVGTVVLYSTGLLEYWHLLVTALVGGASFALNLPARQAIIPDLVGPRHLANAVAMNVAAFNVTRVAGPALGGALIGWAGLEALYWVSIFCYLAGVISVITLPLGPERPRARARVAQEFVSGFRYLGSRPALLGLIGMAVSFSTFGMFHQLLMPVFAEDVLRVGATGLGVLMGTIGAGAVTGSLVVAWLGEGPYNGKVFVLAGVLYGLSVLGFAAGGSYPPALVFLFLAGLFSGIFTSLNTTLLMSNCEPGLRGRVMGIFFTANGFLPLLALVVGAIADQIGAPLTVGIGAVLVVLLIGAQAAAQPALRRLA